MIREHESKHALVITLLLLLGLLLVAGVIIAFNQSMEVPGPVEPKPVTDDDIPGREITPLSFESAVEVGRMMEHYVVEEVGQPIEGFEPAMFLEAFPGLEESDFKFVNSAQGMYFYAEGALSWEYDPAFGPEHSAARAINDQGLVNIIQNVITRTNFNAQNQDDLIRLVESLK